MNVCKSKEWRERGRERGGDGELEREQETSTAPPPLGTHSASACGWRGGGSSAQNGNGRQRQRRCGEGDRCDGSDSKMGVLLYYKYVPLPEPAAVAEWMAALCAAGGLVGRVRVAHEGVNVTVGGALCDLEAHAESVSAHPLLAGADFKFGLCLAGDSKCSGGDSSNARSDFADLSVRIVKEIVTLGPAGHVAGAVPGRHVSPQELHGLLEAAADPSSSPVILLDARNAYESCIGRFTPPPGAAAPRVLVPAIRQFSELPAWIDANAHQLRGKLIVMYCTGGVRCERASAYVRRKGDGFQDVLQLSGGIHRYLETYADGGYFSGKNFVFDHRLAVASGCLAVVGTCLACGRPWDDYSAQARCAACRMLVLICDQCQLEGGGAGQEGGAGSRLCELCRGRHRQPPVVVKEQGRRCIAEAVHEDVGGSGGRRRLRILCLHGFRQSAASFRGRTAALAKRLRGVAELVYVNAPHAVQPATSGTAAGAKLRYTWLTGTHDGSEAAAQTNSWATSMAALQRELTDRGPYDGLLGFSQGAAVATLMAAAVHSSQPRDETEVPLFRFVILCSGYLPPPLLAPASALTAGRVRCPSLHIFGASGGDKHVAAAESLALVEYFASESRTVVAHDCGHIIPAGKDFVDQYADFLRPFLATHPT
eukprot:SM000182S03919  [mRNA]  locus=s182:57282:60712:+ [translate_table: standard]